MPTPQYFLNRYQRTLANKPRLLQQRIAIEADISSKKYKADIKALENQIRTAEKVGEFGINLYDAKQGGYFEDKDFGDFLEESYGLPSSRPKSTPGEDGEASKTGGSLEDVLAERRGNRRVTWGDVGGVIKDRGGEFLDNARGLFPKQRESLSKWATGGYTSPQDNTTLGDRFNAASNMPRYNQAGEALEANPGQEFRDRQDAVRILEQGNIKRKIQKQEEDAVWESRRQNLNTSYAEPWSDDRTFNDILMNRGSQNYSNRVQSTFMNPLSDAEVWRRFNIYQGGR
tara:strand:+ start:95 stop:952 length:858 start_codon:yes stop_codon:yes gene_type:complete